MANAKKKDFLITKYSSCFLRPSAFLALLNFHENRFSNLILCVLQSKILTLAPSLHSVLHWLWILVHKRVKTFFLKKFFWLLMFLSPFLECLSLSVNFQRGFG